MMSDEMVVIVGLRFGQKGFERDQYYDMWRQPGESDADLLRRACAKFIKQRMSYPTSCWICAGEDTVEVVVEQPEPQEPRRQRIASEYAKGPNEIVSGFFKRHGGVRASKYREN